MRSRDLRQMFMPPTGWRNEVGLARYSHKSTDIRMSQFAYRCLNLSPPLTKNNEEVAVLSYRFSRRTTKKFYTVPSQVKNGLLFAIISVTYKSPI